MKKILLALALITFGEQIMPLFGDDRPWEERHRFLSGIGIGPRDSDNRRYRYERNDYDDRASDDDGDVNGSSRRGRNNRRARSTKRTTTTSTTSSRE